MVPNWFLDNLQAFLIHFLIRRQTKILHYWLQVSLRPDCKNLASGPPNLDGLRADHVGPSLSPWTALQSKLLIAGPVELGEGSTFAALPPHILTENRNGNKQTIYY